MIRADAAQEILPQLLEGCVKLVVTNQCSLLYPNATLDFFDDNVQSDLCMHAWCDQIRLQAITLSAHGHVGDQALVT